MMIPALHTVVDGNTSTQPVIVLGASLGTNASAWDALVPVFSAAGFATVRFDLPGHGKSEPATAPFTLADLATAVIVATDALDIDQFDYAGVSVDGGLALELAYRYPEQVKHAAAICTSAYFGGPGPNQERAAQVREHGTESQIAGLAERWFSPKSRAEQPELVARFEDMVRNTSTEGFAQVVEALGTYDARTYLGEISVPVLVISGEHDPGTTPAAGKAIADGTAGARQVVIADAAHQAAAEHPEEVAALLIEFFRS